MLTTYWAAPAVLTVAGTARPPAPVLPPGSTPAPAPAVPQVRHAAVPGMIPRPGGPGLAYLALKTLLGPPKATTHHGGTAYTVQPGDCLWSIAQHFYGDGEEWPRIFDANRGIVTTPGLIKPGMQLVIPGATSPANPASAPAPAPAPVPSLPALPPAAPGVPWSIFSQPDGQRAAVAYAGALLRALGAPPSPGNLKVIYDWEVSEGSGGRYNPLNSGDFAGLATSGTQYGGGANDFPSLAVNVRAVAGILQNDTGFGYGAVVSALRANNPGAARTAIWQSDWAASHYDWGASFSGAPLPG